MTRRILSPATPVALALLAAAGAPLDAQTPSSAPVAPVAAVALSATPRAESSFPEPERVAAVQDRGFRSAYFVYVPPAVRADTGAGAHVHSILVVPNNTGALDDDPLVHERSSAQVVRDYRAAANRLGVVLVMPAFPRPKSAEDTYTHALDRDALLATDPVLQRLDLQLIAIVEHARARLAHEGVHTEPKVLLHGFSAAGMFANRFTMLHPDRVKAVAVGAPGGWPIAPVAAAGGRALPYPVGVADLEQLTGVGFDRAAVAQVPQLLFVGADDTNDSVAYDDGYDASSRALVNRLFGTTPAARWGAAERLYSSTLPLATVITYPGVAHTITPEMWRDVESFLSAHAAR